tara:strand:- start:57262 stop:57642 length:381 start_codon:yes stop_codon:yes gene_type:complete
VFAISSFLSSSNLAFSQENKLVEDGLYKAVLQKETVPDNTQQRPYLNYGEIEITIKDNRISEIITSGNSDRDVVLSRLIGTKLNFNDKGKATTIKVGEYIKDILAEIVTGKWVYYYIEVKTSDIIK